MQANEFKAVLARTRDFAIRPVPICNTEATRQASPARNRSGMYLCPSGLTRATVIETGVPWVEKRPMTVCGDRDYEIQRKNGILVEFELTEEMRRKQLYTVRGKRLIVKATKEPFPLTEVVIRNAKRFLRMTVSCAVVFGAWDEYALEIARREKESAEHAARQNVLYDAQAALMGVARGKLAERDLSVGYRTKYARKADGSAKRDKDGNIVELPEQGWLTITLDTAEKILAILTPEQKAALGAP